MSLHRVVRVVCVASAFLIIPILARAQEVGIKAGINSASLTPEEDEDPDISRRIGFVGGGWIHWSMSPRFSLQTEGLFSEKGVIYKIPPIEQFPGGESEIRIRYVEVPVLARGDFGSPGSPTRFFLVGGLAPAFELGARGWLRPDGEDESARDIGDQIKPFDLGLVGGAGMAFGKGVVEARYTHGLLHINEDDNGDEDRIKNRVFSVTVGFRFR